MVHKEAMWKQFSSLGPTPPDCAVVCLFLDFFFHFLTVFICFQRRHPEAVGLIKKLMWMGVGTLAIADVQFYGLLSLAFAAN